MGSKELLGKCDMCERDSQMVKKLSIDIDDKSVFACCDCRIALAKIAKTVHILCSKIILDHKGKEDEQ